MEELKMLAHQMVNNLQVLLGASELGLWAKADDAVKAIRDGCDKVETITHRLRLLTKNGQ